MVFSCWGAAVTLLQHVPGKAGVTAEQGCVGGALQCCGKVELGGV